MEDSIQISIRLLIVGVSTVSIILLLIVLSSKLLIKIINNLYDKNNKNTKISAEQSEHIAAINAAVDLITSSKGQVESIKSI